MEYPSYSERTGKPLYRADGKPTYECCCTKPPPRSDCNFGVCGANTPYINYTVQYFPIFGIGAECHLLYSGQPSGQYSLTWQSGCDWKYDFPYVGWIALVWSTTNGRWRMWYWDGGSVTCECWGPTTPCSAAGTYSDTLGSVPRIFYAIVTDPVP